VSHDKDGRLVCDMERGCLAPVTHIDEKGWVYCAPHGKQRKMSHRCRKLTSGEIKTLKAGKPISYERKRPAAPRGYLVTFKRDGEDAEVAEDAGRTGAQQLAAELQAACDAGLLSGTFEVHGEALP
jgi:hypothetical protein